MEDQLLRLRIGKQDRSGFSARFIQGNAKRSLDQLIHLRALKQRLADTTNGLQFPIALE